MKAIKLILIPFLMICFSTTYAGPSNESAASKIQRAMKAAPSSISAGAEIRDVDAEWSVLREGSNGWTCFPGVPLNPGDKHPMCNDQVWMDWLWAVKALMTYGTPVTYEPVTVGFSYMLRGDAMVNNGNPVAEPGAEGIWDQEGPHLMMLFPSSVDISQLPQDPNAGGPYVMWDLNLGGLANLVHVMVPLTDRDR